MATNQPVCVADFESYTNKFLPKNAYDYYSSGANEQQTLRENKDGFKRLRLRPRLLRDVSCLDTSTSLLGERVSSAIGLSPTAMQRMAHPDGEVATAKAAASVDVCMILSSLATSTIEEVAEGSPSSLKWFQLLICKHRSLTEDLVKRAEKAGYKAIILTVDTPVEGRRLANVRNPFELPKHLTLANFDQVGLTDVYSWIDNKKLTWDDVKWLKSITRMPIILKGILTGEDAVKAVEIGATGILVSNHGGRQLDGVPSSIEALPEVVKAVDGRVEVYLDGGVRQGTDVLKALALGAKAVFVGRPVLWGLAYGEKKEWVRCLKYSRKNSRLQWLCQVVVVFLISTLRLLLMSRPFQSCNRRITWPSNSKSANSSKQ